VLHGRHAFCGDWLPGIAYVRGWEQYQINEGRPGCRVRQLAPSVGGAAACEARCRIR
jgi:hypothetical protein